MVVTSWRCERLTQAIFNVAVPFPLRLLLLSASREPFSHTVSNKQYRPAPEPNWDVRKIFPFTTSRSPLKISAKIIPGNFFLRSRVLKNNSKNNFAQNFSRDFPESIFRQTRQLPGSRFSENAASHLSRGFLHPIPTLCSRPQKPERKNSPSFHSYIAQPLHHTCSASAPVGIYIRTVGLGVIAMCSPSAGIKSGQPRQLRHCFREVLRKKCTRKKIPEMTLNVTQVTRFLKTCFVGL